MDPAGLCGALGFPSSGAIQAWKASLVDEAAVSVVAALGRAPEGGRVSEIVSSVEAAHADVVEADASVTFAFLYDEPTLTEHGSELAAAIARVKRVASRLVTPCRRWLRCSVR